MNSHVNCEWARNYLPLFLYDELSPEEEDALSAHLNGCVGCSAALEEERRLHAALAAQDVTLPTGLLNSAREGLSQRLAAEKATPAPGLIGRIQDWFVGFTPQALLRPAGALALVAIGFLGGRLMPQQDPSAGTRFYETSVAEPVASRVRRVEPSGVSGDVSRRKRRAFDEPLEVPAAR